MTGVALIDYALPAIALRPLSFILVIAIATVAGYRVGLLSAIAAAVLFTTLETASGDTFTQQTLAWNVLVAAVSLIVVVLLVEVVRKRSVIEKTALSDLANAKAELEGIKQSQETQAALRRAEQRYSAVGESMPFGTWEVSADGRRLLHMSDNYCQLFGMTRDEIEQGGWLTRVPADDAKRFLELWENRESSDIFEGEYRVLGVDGKTYWILARGLRLTNADGETTGWAGFSLDITERKRTEQRLALLSDLGRVLSLSLEPMATIERAAQVVIPRFADWFAVDLVGADGDIQRAFIMHYDDSLTIAARDLSGADKHSLYGPMSTHVIATKDAQLLATVSRETKNGTATNDQGIIDAFRPSSLITVPLVARDQTLGALTLATSGSTSPFAAEDVDFANIIARRVALAFDNALLYERERRVADIFQRASLPATLPKIPGITIDAHYVSGAKEAEIGGDWYDAFQLGDGRLGLSIGDVAGKGLQAASIMSTVRLLIRATALEELTPSRVLSRANKLLLNDRPVMVTALFGILDPEELTFTCSIAGHPPPLVVDQDGEVSTGVPVAPALGIANDAVFPEQSLMLPLGSLLVLYTDGLVESKRGKLNAEDSLAKVLQTVVGLHLANPAEAIAARLIETPPSDDVAILTVSAATRPLLELDITLPAQPNNGRIFRQALRRFYLAAGLTEDKISLLQVAIGEAITNSVQHAYGIRGGAVRVRGRIESGNLVIEISDTGRWRGAHEDGGGYGLQILKGIVPDVAISAGENGTVVRLAQPIGRVIT
jgi:PAS domain S-box-containing protein